MKHLRPFSNNIIFFDTEFSGFDVCADELLSVGMVKAGGEELYLEIEHRGSASAWVRKNVLPLLSGPRVSRTQAKRKIRAFVGKSSPFIVSYVNDFDAVYLLRLFAPASPPFHWIPIDFASMLFAMGVSPESFDWRDKDNFFRKLGIDRAKYREHHALDDARLLRDVYVKLLR